MNKHYKKRLSILSVVFIVSGLFAIWTTTDSKNVSSFNNTVKNLAYSDTTSINTISISDGSGIKVLKRSNTKWIINEQYKVRQQLITLLFFALNKLEIKRPIDKNKNQIIDELKKYNLLIDVRGEENRKFYIMPNPNDVNSSYYLEEGTGAPFIVYVPGVKGELSNLLRLNVNDWRVREIFRSTERSLQSISVVYNDKKQEGFTILYQDNSFVIPGLPEADTLKMKKYITLYSILGGESFVTADSITSHLIKDVAAAEISVKDIDGEKNNSLKIYFYKQQLYGFVEKSKEFMLLNPQVYKYVLVDKDYFKK